ncbi:MAG: ABC transporter permease [Pseudomonadota bacterium]
MLDNVLHAAILATTPILLAALGGLINRQAGIVNIGLEAMMLSGALAALIAAHVSGSWEVGLLAAAVAGLISAAPLSILVTRFGANEIVAGLGLNVLIAGLIGYLLSDVYGVSGTLRLMPVPTLPRIDLPFIADVPVLGAILSGKDVLTWAAWILVPLTALLLTRTRIGLRLRACGSSPATANSVGLSVPNLRDGATLAAGALAGLGGAALSLGLVGLFSEGLTGGRGFIALAAFYFGRNRPWPTAFACILFGFFDAAQIRLQGGGLPPELVQVLPYAVVILALTLASWRRRRGPSPEP